MDRGNLNMTFDQLQRYRLAAELIEEVRENTPLSILDAGSREGFLGGFLPDDRIIGIDRSDFSGDRFVKGDVLCLPFSDSSFDIVLTLDVLEHIPEMDRLKFLGELKRVSRKAVIVGAPFKSGEVEEAEGIINDLSRKITGKENIFLSEHQTIGLPDLDRVLTWASDPEYQTLVIPNGYLPRWILMVALNEYLGRLPEAWDLIFASNRLYHQQFYRADNSLPAYRRMIMISRGQELDIEKIHRKFSSSVGSDNPAPRHDFDLIKDILEAVESEKDASIIKISREKAKLAGRVAELERKAGEEVNLLTAIIEEKTGRLAEIQNSRAYQISRKINRLFDRGNS